MNREKIVEAATKLWLSGGPDNFSFRAVAKALNVGPTTIRAHFKGGVGDLLNEIAGSALAGLAPPYKPQQAPEDFLRNLFRAALSTFRQATQLGRLLVLHLSNDPLLNPIFAEQVCATLESIAKNGDAARGFNHFLEHFVGLIIVETSNLAVGEPEAAKAKILEQVGSLSGLEFPTLKVVGEKLAADYLKRGAAEYIEKTACAKTDSLLADLAKGVA